MNVVDPQAWLADVLTRIAAHPAHGLDELVPSGVSNLGSSGVTTHVNKVHHVTTITRVAEQLGEERLATRRHQRNGNRGRRHLVYGVGEDGILPFTDFGIESLIELIKMYKDDPTSLKRWDRSE
jgi:IS66 C-terminal element